MKNKPDLQDRVVFWSILIGTICYFVSFVFCMIYPNKWLWISGFLGFGIALFTPLGLALYNSTIGK